MFHSRDGLFFARDHTGCVRIIKTSDNKNPREDTEGTNILFMLVLGENEWASVVCSVSKDGEDYARWMRARRFHGTDLPFGEHELKNIAPAEELTPGQREWMDAPAGPLEPEWVPTQAEINANRESDHCGGVITPESDDQVISRLQREVETGRPTFAWKPAFKRINPKSPTAE